MKLNLFSSLLITSSLIFSITAQAQGQAPNNQQYPHNNYSNQARYYQAPKPKPMTTEVLKHRLDKQLDMTKRQMAFDKKQADVYAANFAKYQKAQAAELQKMMAQAEKQRQMTVKRLEMQQQHLLNQFSKFQIAKDSKN